MPLNVYIFYMIYLIWPRFLSEYRHMPNTTIDTFVFAVLSEQQFHFDFAKQVVYGVMC